MFGKIHVLPILRSVAYSFPILILQISHPLFSPSRIAEPFSSEVLSQKGNLKSHMYLNLLCKKAFITLNTLATFTFFFFLSDMNHFSSRVQKAASRDMWDIGLLIHNIFIADVTREEMIWMLSLQCNHYYSAHWQRTFASRCGPCCKCRWRPDIFNIPDICNSWLARISLFSDNGSTLNLLT